MTLKNRYHSFRQKSMEEKMQNLPKVFINSMDILHDRIALEGEIVLPHNNPNMGNRDFVLVVNTVEIPIVLNHTDGVRTENGLRFLHRIAFGEEYQYIFFGMKKNSDMEFLPISYRDDQNIVVRGNQMLWGTGTELYSDYFLNDYGQSLAIRYLREIISDGEKRYGLLRIPVGQTKSLEELAADVKQILDFIDRKYSKETNIPLELQNGVLCFLYAAFAKAFDMMADYHADPESYDEEWNRISLLLKKADDSNILGLNTNRYMKAFMFHLKYGRNCDYFRGDADKYHLQMRYQDVFLYQLSSFETLIFRLNNRNGQIVMEGAFHLPAGIDVDELQPCALINSREIVLDKINNMNNKYRFNRTYLHEIGFRLDIPVPTTNVEIRFGFRIDGFLVLSDKYIYSTLVAPVSDETKSGFAYINGISFYARKDAIICKLQTEDGLLFSELLLDEEICHDESLSVTDRHAIIFVREFYYLARVRWEVDVFDDMMRHYEALRGEEEGIAVIKHLIDLYATKDAPNRQKRVWVIIDRPDRADDNGEAFFLYMRGQKPDDIDVYFLLQKDAGGYKELSKAGCVLEPLSVCHCLLHVISEFVISSQMQEFVMNPFNKKQKYLRDLGKKPDIIFLQHGVIHNHHGKVMGKYGRDFRGFITSGIPEYEYIKSEHFHYTEKNVWLTGLCRFDRLYDDDKKMITIMPTWRKWLTHRGFDENINSLAWIINEGFEETEYFKFYDSLINDPKLLEAAEQYGYQIALILHVNFLHLSGMFRRSDQVKIYDYEEQYRKVFAESSLIVTDYTSAVFDFAYLHKPIVYCQFDKEEFYAGHTVDKGYFNFEQDGFGEVTYTKDECVDVLISYIQSGCKLKEIYRERIDTFFPNVDRNCCERLYQKLQEVHDQKARGVE